MARPGRPRNLEKETMHMPNDLLTLPMPQAPATMSPPQEHTTPITLETGTRGVNIRGVPFAIWQRARQNALLSNLPFKAYIIRLLAQSQPFRVGDKQAGTVDTTDDDLNDVAATDTDSD